MLKKKNKECNEKIINLKNVKGKNVIIKIK